MKRLALILTVLLVSSWPALAHEGHVHHYMGTITTASDSQLSLKTTDGKTVTFKVDETTRILKGNVAAGVKDLAPGTRAVIDTNGGKEPALARTIKLPAPAKRS